MQPLFLACGHRLLDHEDPFAPSKRQVGTIQAQMLRQILIAPDIRYLDTAFVPMMLPQGAQAVFASPRLFSLRNLAVPHKSKRQTNVAALIIFRA